MSKHSKGTAYELKARKLLEEDHWLCEKKNYNRWASKDFYNLFDILAIRHNVVRLIQIKTNPTDFYKARKEIRNWIIENTIFGIKCEVWLKEPRKAWRCEEIGVTESPTINL